MGSLPGGADDLVVAGMPDDDDGAPPRREASHLGVHLANERTRRVDGEQVPLGGVRIHLRRHAMRGEHEPRVRGHVELRLDEDRPARFEVLDDAAVMDDLATDVDRRPPGVERALDGRHGAVDSRAEPARVRKQDAQGHCCGAAPFPSCPHHVPQRSQPWRDNSRPQQGQWRRRARARSCPFAKPRRVIRTPTPTVSAKSTVPCGSSQVTG